MTKVVTTPSVTISAVDALAEEYATLREEIAVLESRKQEIVEKVKSLMNDNSLKTSTGEFKKIVRKSYSWSLEALKAATGRQWQSFVQPDNKLVKARMETKDLIGCQLEVVSTVSETEAVSFYSK